MKNIWEKEHEKLYNDVINENLTYKQVDKRYSELCDLVPFDVSVNFIMLDNLINEKYKNDSDYISSTNKRIFKIDIYT